MKLYGDPACFERAFYVSREDVENSSTRTYRDDTEPMGLKISGFNKKWWRFELAGSEVLQKRFSWTIFSSVLWNVLQTRKSITLKITRENP